MPEHFIDRAPAMSAPYDYDEFERRGVWAAARRRSNAWSAAASVAALGLVVTLAVVTQRSGLTDTYAISGSLPALQPDDLVAEQGDAGPALVDLSQLELQGELEDRIAWLDAQLSVGRVASAPPGELQQLQAAREQLADSLQHVSYAHSLLNL
jgi:hypothetical protein